MSKLVPSMHQSSLVFYTFLGPVYIILIALPYRAAIVYYYLVLVVGLFIFNTLMPYLGAIYIILDLDESYLETALKM